MEASSSSYYYSSTKAMAIALMLIAMASSHGVVQVSNAQTICNVSVSGLMSCKPAVTAPNPTPPSASCCSVLSHADFKCLCSYKSSPVLPSLGIDPNLAVQLPQKCHLPNSPKC